jgi:predicted 3-demethylubiquinone-9 3-methyltransferase (glyoxalase superfamily)
MQKITPFLWFDQNAEEATNYYLSVFKDAKINKILRWGDVGPGPKGSVLTIDMEIAGQSFTAMNGGTHQKLSPAFSFVVHCESQEEVDYYWDKLGDGGQELACGWLTDKFGVSWQITPTRLLEMQEGESEKWERAMKAMMEMVKLDIAKLEAAYEGK